MTNEQQNSESVEELENAGAEELGKILEDAPSDEERSSARERLNEQREAAAHDESPRDTREDLTPEEAEAKAETYEEKRARIAQILERGILNEKLRAISEAAPDGYVAVFPRNTPEDIDRIRALGGRMAKREDLTREVSGLHGDGDESLRVGDVVMMLLDEDTAQIIDEVQEKNVEKKLARGKREYHDRRDQDVPVIDYSQQQRVGGR